MRKSTSVIEIMNAISEAKMQMRSLEKTSKNPHFKSEYADINEVFDVLKKPLYDSDIGLSQFPDIVNGQFVLTTVLTHLTTGEFIETDYQLLLEKQTSQGQGSALTYAKRQSLSAIFSLHEFDDDGQEAEGKSVSNDPKPPSSDLPQPTVKSLMQKYILLYKVANAGTNQKCLTIFERSKQMNQTAAEAFIKQQFEESFGDKAAS